METQEYTNREFMIFNVSELNLIDFTQVLETSIDTVRRSVDWNLNKIGRILGGLVSAFKIYNRALTTAEVNINYNTLKNRFGI